MGHRYLLPCLVLSGFAGLAYEILWVRLLSLSFGSTTLSYSTVLAVFFGGLALGAHLAGRYAVRLARPARAYALIELATGISAAAMLPVLLRLGDVFAAIDPGPGPLGALVRFLVATPILALPTILMGATLPVVSRAVVVSDGEIGRGTGLVYGFNTAGAALGAYLVTYHALPALGVVQSIGLAVVANLAAALVALRLERREPGAVPASARDEAPADPLDPETRKLATVAVALAFLGGLAAIVLQVVWVRIFTTLLHGTVYGVGSVLISVLAGIALGSLFIARTLSGAKHPGTWFTALQVVTLLSVAILCASFPRLSHILAGATGSTAGGLGPLHWQLAGVLVATLLPTFCAGASLPLLVRIAEKRAAGAARTLGRLYAANTVGSILGSILGGFVLLPEAGSQATVFVALAGTALAGAIGGLFLCAEYGGALRAALALVPLLALYAYGGFDVQALHAKGLANATEQPIYFAEGRSATVEAYDRGTLRGLRINGLGQGSLHARPPSHSLESLLVALVPAAHLGGRGPSLVVGLGTGVTVDALLRMGFDDVTVLEIEPEVVNAARMIYRGAGPFDTARLRIEINDARHHLLINRRPGGRRYDLITSMPAHPWIASSVFTRDFFELAASSLGDRGVFCTWFGLGKMDREASESVLRAFTSTFPHYAAYFVLAAGAYYLVGSRGPLTLDPERLRALHALDFVEAHEILKDPYFLPAALYASGTPDTPAPPEGVVNTDDSAFVETHAPRSSGASGILKDFLPEEYLIPSMVPEHGRATFYLDLFEKLLGTPGGLIPYEGYPIDIVRAESTLAGAGEVLDPESLAYLEGRAYLAKQDLARARERLSRAAEGTGDIAARARKFVPLTYPKGDQWVHLASLPPSSDVLAKLFEIDPERARPLVPREDRDPMADPIGWLLHLVVHGGEGPLDPESRRAFDHVGPAVRRSRYAAIAAACAEVAARYALEAERRACEGWLHGKRAGQATAAFREGATAAGRKDFRLAAERLEEANRLNPGHAATQELYLRALVALGGRLGLDALLAELRFHGRSEAYVNALLREAEEGRLGVDER